MSIEDRPASERARARGPARRRSDRRSPLRRTAAALGVAALLAACSTVRVEGESDFAMVAGDSYAWVVEPDDLARADGEDLPWREVRDAASDELDARELVETSRSDADWLLELRLDVGTEVRTNHGYFNMYVAEQVEEGSVTLFVLDGRSGRELWSAESRRELRTSSRTTGGLGKIRWHDSGEARDWDIDGVVGEIVDRLPVNAADPSR